MKNFLISGYGRSGTKFLANICNKSKTWICDHEFAGIFNLKDEVAYKDCENHSEELLNYVSMALNNDYVGNVNSYLRYDMDYFHKVDYRAIIYRDIKEIMVSVANRRNTDEWEICSLEIARYSKYFHQYLKKTYPVIDFRLMTTSVDYLRKTLFEIGIMDVDIDVDTIREKKNKTRLKKIKCFSELPVKVQNVISGALKWK